MDTLPSQPFCVAGVRASAKPHACYAERLEER